MEFNAELYKVKGMFDDDDMNPIIEGFYCEDEHGRQFIVDDNFKFFEINIYSLCRNTGIKDKNGVYLFEYDVIKYNSFGSKDTYAYIDFDELRKRYVVRAGINMRSYREIEQCCNIQSIGKNIILSDADYDWFLEYERREYEKSKGSVIDNSYCPSKFRR